MPGPRSRLRPVVVFTLTGLCFLLESNAFAEPVDFARDVQPILVKSCVRCHGPKKRQGGLALDARDAALAGGDDGPAIVPGKSAESRLYRFVAGLDEETVMPPDGDELPADQVAILKHWIDQGAPWPDASKNLLAAEQTAVPWSFKKPVRPALPEVHDNAWPRNAVDRFVLARLDKEGLAHAPEADPATLLRRVSLDLTGLPPTVEEVDAFLADTSPDAYERAVDRLLKSPHYGERWARFWLDRARYADTNGYEKDRERSIWPYRDWVINALNTDMPFNQFTIEQIAGDLLPNATLAQKVATGFHRNTMTNEEGGIDVEEFRFASLVDRLNTTGAVWLGLTINCCQCHSHKYDPITQREYYQLMAFLNNADEPEIDVPSPALLQKRDAAEAEIRALEASRAGKVADLDAKLEAWEKQQHPVHWTVVRPSKLASKKHATMTVQADGSVLVSGDKPNNDVYEVEIPIDANLSAAPITAIRLEVLPDPSLPENGPGRAPLFSVGDFLLTEFLVDQIRADETRQRLTLNDASEDYADKGHPAALAIDGVTDTGWSVKGAIGQPHASVFSIKNHRSADGSAKAPDRLMVTLHQEYIHQMTIGRFRLSVTSDPQPVKASGLTAEVEAAILVPRAERTDAQQAAIRDHFLSVVPELADLNKTIAAQRKALPKPPTTMVMQERKREHARVTKVHKRGEFLKEADPVEPAVPAALHPLPSDAPRNRLTLARWLVADDNPLVGRVIMNQIWQGYFGRGLVTTPEDFGTQGNKPTHPELLDWLAVEFPARGWSLKAMHRLIVTSATYRQSSKASPELVARDPKNEWLARGPRFRVDAEMVRDIALAASGLLSEKVGGPSVYPPQPEGVTSLAYGGGGWPVSQGEDRYRRGLYTYLKRTAPYAAFIVMDAPTSETVCVRRERSNTPLQALTLLNDAVFLEAAQALARRAMAHGDSPESRMTYAFRLCVARGPRPDELQKLLAFRDIQLARFRSGALDPIQVAGLDPKAKPAPNVDPAEAAAWTTIARALLNLDETITKE